MILWHDMTWNETYEMVWIISLFFVSCNLWILLSVLQKCHLSFPPPVFKPFPICFSLFWSGFVSKYILLSLAGKPQFHGDLFSRNFKCPPAWYRYQKYRGFVHRPYLYNNQIARETSKHLSWTSVTSSSVLVIDAGLIHRWHKIFTTQNEAFPVLLL